MGEFKSTIRKPKDAAEGAACKTGLLGGSFNPPHWGHMELARHALNVLWVDEVWVIPCFEHPLGKVLVSFEDRFAMCRLAFSDKEFGDEVKIMDVEKRLGGKSYTLRTVRHLQAQHPDCSFSLIVGEDAAAEAKSWHQYEELKRALPWHIVPRGKNSPIPDVSATEIRTALQKGNALEKYLPKDVESYIREHRLYG